MYARAIEVPREEPVSVNDVKSFMGLPTSNNAYDTLLFSFIRAARDQGEILTGRSLVKRKFVQNFDSMPYYTDAGMSSLAYPPSYYSLPRYSTTLWNYSQMIKLLYAPVWSVDFIRYVGTDGSSYTLSQDTDFILDRLSEPARVFPKAGQFWPANLYVPNSCVVQFTAGYSVDPATPTDTHTVLASPPNQQPDSTIVTAVPSMIILGILNLVAYWFNNRGCMGQVPENIHNLFLQNAVVDFSPTRG